MNRPTSSILTLILFAAPAVAQLPPPPQAFPNGPAPVLEQPRRGTVSGSVVGGQVQPEALTLTLSDAIQRGLKYNLAVLTGRDDSDTAAADRRRALSTLLPNISAGVTQNSLQNNLVAFGLTLQGIPPSPVRWATRMPGSTHNRRFTTARRSRI